MIVNVKGKALAVGLIWQEAKRSDLALIYRSLRATDGVFLPKDKLLGIATGKLRGKLALAPMLARHIQDGVAVVALAGDVHISVVAQGGHLMAMQSTDGDDVYSDMLLDQESYQRLSKREGVIHINKDVLKQVVDQHSDKRFLIKKRSNLMVCFVLGVLIIVLGMSAYGVHRHLSHKRALTHERLSQISAFERRAKISRAIDLRTRASHVIARFKRLEGAIALFTHGFVFKSLELDAKHNRAKVSFVLSPMGNMGKVPELLARLQSQGLNTADLRISHDHTQVSIRLMLHDQHDQFSAPDKIALLALIGSLQDTHLRFELGKAHRESSGWVNTLVFNNLFAAGFEKVSVFAKQHNNFHISTVSVTSGAHNQLTYRIEGNVTHE